MSEELRTKSGDELMTADQNDLVVPNQPSLITADQDDLVVPNQANLITAARGQLVAEANRSRNQAWVSFVLLPMIFLTVALLGGLRVNAADRALIFVPPPLITLVLAVLLLLLFVRGRLIELGSWMASHYPPLTNVAHGWTLLTLFFASAQAFNSVLPERGLLHWLFSFFFLWTLWNNQFSSFDARRLLRSLVVLFGTAFVLKHMLLASLYAADGGWLKSLAGALLQGVSLGTLDAPAFAPATGYISFFTLVLYIVGLVLISKPQLTNSSQQSVVSNQ